MSDHMKLFRAVGREIEWRDRAEKAEAEVDRLQGRVVEEVDERCRVAEAEVERLRRELSHSDGGGEKTGAGSARDDSRRGGDFGPRRSARAAAS